MSRFIKACVAVGLALTTGIASAGPRTGAMATALGAAAMGASPGDTVDTTEQSRRQVMDLLSRARQAMDEGRLETAEALVSQAESMNVGFNLFHLGDTPKKVRRDLEQLKGQQGAVKPPADPFAGRTEPAPPGATAQFVDAGQPAPPTVPAAIGGPPPAAAWPASAQGAEPQSARARSDSLVLGARRALAVGDVRRAAEMLDEARRLGVGYDFLEDSPAKVDALLTRLNQLNARSQQEKATEEWRRGLVDVQLQQAEALLRWKDYDEAARLAEDARRLRVTFGPFDTTPDTVLARIADARRASERPAVVPLPPTAQQVLQTGAEMPLPAVAALPPTGDTASPASLAERKTRCLDLVREARAALAAGELERAEALARQAESLGVPDSEFGAQDDRYFLVFLEVDKQRRRGMATPAGGGMAIATDHPGGGSTPFPGAQAIYDPTNDPTRNIPAAAGAVPVVTDGPQSEAHVLLMQGENALRQRDMHAARALFLQAQARADQLDPVSRQRLQDRLQMVAQSEIVRAAGQEQSLLSEAQAAQQLLARQISAEVARFESQARQLQGNDPAQAEAALRQARSMVEKAGLDASSRDMLLRRIDRDLSELNRYVEANRPRIELAQRNKSVKDEIEREQKMKIEVQEKLALLVDEYNRMMDEQRFAEAEVLAKRAAELAPDEPIVVQLQAQSKFVRRVVNNAQVGDLKERGFTDALASVEASSVGFDDRNPISFGDLRNWEKLTTRRGVLKAESQRRRNEKELLIEQRLKTPVSVKYHDAPLSQVMDNLAKMSQVNIHLDPRGLAEEGVSPSTTVTIDLSQEIMLKSALNLILEPLHLSYVIKDEVLKVTSERLKDGAIYTLTYNVADLVMPIPNFTPSNRMGLAGALYDAHHALGVNSGFTGASTPLAVLASNNGAAGSAMIDPKVLGQFNFPINSPGGGGPPATGSPQPIGFGPGGMGGGVEPDFDSLISLITATIAPTSWSEVGGAGAIERFPGNLSLVISQTQEVHEQIADLMDQLRRLQDLQVTIEVRFITLSDNFFEQIGIDFDFDINDNADKPFQIFGRPDGLAASQTNRAQFTAPGALAPGGFDFSAGNPGNPPRDVQDRDLRGSRSATVGLSAPGVFSADLDIPFSQSSFQQASGLTTGVGAAGITGGASLGFAILSDLEAFFFINAVQGDNRTNVLQAPKVTLFNGQQAFVSDTAQSPFVISVIPVVGDFAAAQQPVIVVLSEGTFLTVQAVVSNDRRFVRVTLVPFFSRIGNVDTFTFTGSETSSRRSSANDGPDGPIDEEESTVTREGTTVQLPTFAFTTVTTTVSVPDGGTVLLGGIKNLSEERRENGVPLLNKIPFINRLFNNIATGKSTRSLMMMVTPRIIIQEEEEALLGVPPAP